MMKSSVKEILESLRLLDSSERSSSLPSPSTFRAPMPLIRQSLPAKFRNAISLESKTIEKEDKDWSTEQITQSAEKEKTGNEVVKISTAQMSRAKNSHDPEWINSAEYFVREVNDCFFVLSFMLYFYIHH